MQKPQVFFNLFINNASLLLVSIGMTFVILTGGIDLSVGGMIALTSTASAALLKAGVSPFAVMPLMIVFGVVFGVTLGSLIHFLKVQPFIATLMGLFFARGLAYLISLTSVTITDSVYKSWRSRPSHSAVLQRVRVHSDAGRSADAARGDLSAVLHALRAHAVRDWQQRTICPAHGAAGRAHENHRLWLERLLLRAGRHRHQYFAARRLWPVRHRAWNWTRSRRS